MKIDKYIQWSILERKEIDLSMYYYSSIMEMQFDMRKGLVVITSNIKVKQAREIRDRLNEFIAECEK